MFPLNLSPTPVMDYPPLDSENLFTISSYNQGGDLYDLSMQTVGNTAISYSNGFMDSKNLMWLNMNPNDGVTHLPQPLMSEGTGNAGVQSMPPPPNPRKRKAPTLREEDWEPVKERVIELHVNQDIPLNKVMDIIEEEFPGFTAT
jgi:hypothetical protein